MNMMIVFFSNGRSAGKKISHVE